MRYRQPSDAPATSLALCLLFAALSGACTAPEPRTQVMLIIDADSEVQTLATQLAIDIESRSEFDHIDGAPMTQRFEPMDASEWPFSIALLPQGRDARRSYRLTMTLFDAAGPIARLRAHSGFVAQATLALRLRFSAACLRAASLMCRDQETCFDGGCVSALIDAQSLPLLSGGIANGFAPADGGSGEWMPATSGDGDCPTTGASCTDDTNVCTMNVVVGTGCQRECRNQQATAGAADGCCLDEATMNSSTDPDCKPACGNGKLDTGEMCDPCPTSCTETDTDACTDAVLRGTGCNVQCVEERKTTSSSGDKCCLNGPSADDTDCDAPDPMCGNGMIEAGEDCDRNCPSCDDSDVCTDDRRPTPCLFACQNNPLGPSGSRIDGCCPRGANANDDSDCIAVCGNDVKEPGERCDPCTCVDLDSCTREVETGSGCDLTCKHEAITSPASGDMCCPKPGANANNDSDCTPESGNGEVEIGEQCDEVSMTCMGCRTVTPTDRPPSQTARAARRD